MYNNRDMFVYNAGVLEAALRYHALAMNEDSIESFRKKIAKDCQVLSESQMLDMISNPDEFILPRINRR